MIIVQGEVYLEEWHIAILKHEQEYVRKRYHAVVRTLVSDTARILDYFISHRFHYYSVDQVAKDLVLVNKIVSEAINQLEKRELVRQDKTLDSSIISNKKLRYALFIESMTANTIIRAATEIANTEKNLLESEKQEKENKN